MRLYRNISYRRLKFAWPLLFGILISVAVFGQDNQDSNEKRPKTVSIKLTVTDETGKALPNAQIVVGEGMIHAETGEDGSFAFKAFTEDFVTVSLSGYDKQVSSVEELISGNVIRLKKAGLFLTSEDAVPMPFTTIKKRSLTGSSMVFGGNQLEKYPSTDLRNAFTGLATGLEVVEKNGSPGLNAEEDLGNYGATQKIGLYTRGRSPIFMIDDIPTDITEMPLDPGEIESVTVIKDIVGKAMFGPQGADGIIFIKTKRGRKNERILNVNIESGVSTTDRFPEWVSGSEYATLNNTARTNSGLDPLYSSEDVAAYTRNDPYDKYHPSTNYRNMMLKNTMAFRRANISSTGGNGIVQYYAYLGYSGEGDIYKMGPQADYNRINTRSNIDVKINDLFKVQFDFFGGLTYRRSANYGYDADYTSDDESVNTALDIVEMNSLLGDITTIPPVAFPVYASYDQTSKVPWYGVSSNYKSNPIGNLTNNGYYTESGRTGSANIALDYDLSEIVPGLKSKTYVGFNAFNLLRIGKAENYIAYIATPSKTVADNDTILLSKVHDGVDMPGQAKLHDYYYQRFAVYENLSYEKSFGLHNIQSVLTYYLSKVSMNGIEEPQRQQNLIWTGLYSYNNKYTIQGVMNYAGTYSFDKGKRYAMFPSVGLGWVVSEESFMSDVKFVDYLKLRGEAGILGYENFMAPFYYLDRWSTNSSGSAFGPYSAVQWFGSNTDNSVYRTSASRIGNPDLTWEKRKEFSVGLDALMLNRKLSVEVNYYNNTRDGIITQLTNTMPYFAGISAASPWYNYNKIRYSGLEVGVNYTDKIGNVRFSFGGNAVVQNSKILKYNQPNYSNAYQSRIGKPSDAYWGQTLIGRFASDAEALIVPQIFDEVLHTGDLKYRDMNNDGVIDDSDQSQIGHTSPRLVYAMNLKLNYKDFEFTLIGTGRAFYDIPMTNQYFLNGWGDNNYSAFVRDNIGGAYPALTYYKVNNNFVASDFWLRKGGFFKIQNAELAWNIPMKSGNVAGARAVRLYVRGSNLLTFSKIKDVDPESINSGVSIYPLFRTFSGGVKLIF